MLLPKFKFSFFSYRILAGGITTPGAASAHRRLEFSFPITFWQASSRLLARPPLVVDLSFLFRSHFRSSITTPHTACARSRFKFSFFSNAFWQAALQLLAWSPLIVDLIFLFQSHFGKQHHDFWHGLRSS